MIKPLQYPYNTGHITLPNGCNMNYIDEGEGDTFLFIHGLATYALSWRKNIDELKKSYRCIAVDLPGNGLSDRGDYPYGISFFAASVYELIAKLNLKNIVLIGHSMGGQVAIRLALLYPELINKLILCAPAGFETFNGFERSLYKSALQVLDFFASEDVSLAKTIRTSFYQVPSFAEQMIDELSLLMHTSSLHTYRNMIEMCIDSMLSKPVFDELSLLRTQTLVLYGERDALIPNRMIHPVTTRKIAEEVIKLIPHAKLIMIPQCGHFLQIEKAELVNAYLKEFVKGSFSS